MEDRLSDALHERLTEQFVDRRAAVVARSGAGELVIEVTAGGEVLVQGLPAGRMEGFAYQEDARARETPRRASAAPPTARCAATSATACARSRKSRTTRSRRPPTAASAGGARRWAGWSPPTIRWLPRVEPLPSELLDAPLKEKVRKRLAAWVEGELARVFRPVLAAESAAARAPCGASCSRSSRASGPRPAARWAARWTRSTADERRELGRLGVTVGRLNVYFSDLLSAEALSWRGLLYGLRAPGPRPMRLGAPSVAVEPGVASAAYAACGYQVVGARAVRVDRLERLAGAARRAAREGAFAVSREMLAAAGAGPDEVARDAGGPRLPERRGRASPRGQAGARGRRALIAGPLRHRVPVPAPDELRDLGRIDRAQVEDRGPRRRASRPRQVAQPIARRLVAARGPGPSAGRAPPPPTSR